MLIRVIFLKPQQPAELIEEACESVIIHRFVSVVLETGK